MKYSDARPLVRTGDVIAVEGRGFIQTLIRKFTGQSFNHVGMFVWLESGLYIYEFIEGKGFQFLPASTWLENRMNKKQFIYWCKAPQIVHDNEQAILTHVTEIREAPRSERNYNYWELPVLWASQYFNFNVEVLSGVCSTSIAVAWKKTGFTFEKWPRPGDYMHVSRSVTIITK